MKTDHHNPFDEAASEYDQWFERHKHAYQSELLALKQFVPIGKHGVEIGVGTGRFASELGITEGLEPASTMAAIARQRGINVVKGFAEDLPYREEHFDFLLMVTVDCFVQDSEKVYSEAFRVLKPGGSAIIGLLDKNGAVAKEYESRKKISDVYRQAHFHTTEETVEMLERAGFQYLEFCQTLTDPDPSEIERPTPGYEKGSFVVIKAVKPS